MSAEHIRSQPEQIYRQLDEPQTTDSKLARVNLMHLLELVPTANNSVVPWRSVSDAVIQKSGMVTTQSRSPDELLAHVQKVEAEYPWLLDAFSMHPKRPCCSDELTLFARSHIFEDYAGLLGISSQEGMELHAAIDSEQIAPQTTSSLAQPNLYVVSPIAA